MSCRLVSVLRWEVVDLQNIVVLFMLRLAMGEGDDEEFGLDLLHAFALCEHSRYDFIRARFTYLEMLAVVGVAEDFVALECLTLIRHHVAFNAYIFSFWLHNDRHVFRHFEAIRVVEDVLLLKLCSSTNLMRVKEGILIDLGENMSYFFKAKCRCYLVDFVHLGIFKLNKPVHVVDLGWLIQCLDVNTHTVGIIGILRIIAVQVPHALFNHSIFLPEANKLGKLIFVHERNIINMAENLPVEHN